MSSLGVAVVGCGNIGQVHIDRWKSISGAELLACIDVERERAKQMSEKFCIPNFYESLDPVLKDGSVDILDVCTPTYTHREIVEAALEYGKNVIVEKPIALKLKDAESMIGKARSAGRKLMVAHVLRFWAEYTVTRSFIMSGEIGMPVFAKASRLIAHIFSVWKDWHNDPNKGGGVFIDTSIHDLDFFIWTFGNAEEIYAQGGTLVRKADSHDHTRAFVSFKNKLGAYVEGSWIMPEGYPFSYNLEVIGTKGLIQIGSVNPKQIDIFLTGGSVKRQKIVLETRDPYFLELNAFKECVKEDKPVPVSGEDGKKALELAIAGVISIQRRKPVKLPLEEDFPAHFQSLT
ncbi:MAG: Gfo/Idh/MocA family oxidoreductase [Candidatus Brockarchaeota archaeon]|nr:Gfo/Idh/MocA family oxidoreductase [Candidatus Brockarchaeota archaeon]